MTDADGHAQSKLLTVRIRDTVQIHCPKFDDRVTEDQAEYSIIHMVRLIFPTLYT